MAKAAKDKEKDGKSNLDAAFKAFQAGDVVGARAFARQVIAQPTPDDTAAVKRVAKALLGDEAGDPHVETLAADIVARTRPILRPYLWALGGALAYAVLLDARVGPVRMTETATTITKALEAYQRFDPPGWVDVYRIIPWWAGILGMALGLLMMTFGNGRLFRLAAAPLGAIVALLWTPLLAIRFGHAADARPLTTFAMAGLGALGLLFPPGALFFICGTPGGLLGGELVGAQDWVMGFLPGFLVAGALGAAAHRSLGAVVSSVGGAWLLVIGLLATVAPMGTLASSLAGQPWGCLIAAGLFAIAGAVFQLFVRLSDEERAQLKDEKRRAKRRRDEQKATEKRWETYSKDKGLDT